MIHKLQAEKVFEKQLALIQLNSVKSFVLDVFQYHTAEYFWTVPVSISGKYHPAVNLGKGGLVRHVKLAVWWGIELFRSYNLPQVFQDYVIAALLLHDIAKNGKELDVNGQRINKDALWTHGGDLATDIWRNTALRKYDSFSNHITYAIAGHMGQWTGGGYEVYADFENETDRLQQKISQIVHLADYAASRKVDEQLQLLTTELEL